MNLRNEIIKLKEKKNAIILAHYYQLPEIQDLADVVEDSLGLSRKAASTKAEIIVFAGVNFMAETAKILNPGKKVLLPDLNAGCSLADSCSAGEFKKFIDQNPDHYVISYINCSAEVKTMSDVICTSGNAVEIVKSVPVGKKIIFAPDKNLGRYVQEVTGREMLLWDGTCKVHDLMQAGSVIKLMEKHPDALLVAHPECNAAVLQLAGFIGSTAKMLEFTGTSERKKFIVATEWGIIHQMKKIHPDKEFISVNDENNCNCSECEYMKLITPEKLYRCLLNEEPEIILDDEIMKKAFKPIEKMLQISASLKK